MIEGSKTERIRYVIQHLSEAEDVGGMAINSEECAKLKAYLEELNLYRYDSTLERKGKATYD